MFFLFVIQRPPTKRTKFDIVLRAKGVADSIKSNKGISGVM